MAVILLSGRMDIANSKMKQQANVILKAFNRAHTESLYSGKPIRVSFHSNKIAIEAYNHKNTWVKLPATSIELAENSTLCILSLYDDCTKYLRSTELKPHYIYFSRHLPPEAIQLQLSNTASKRALIIQMNNFGDTSILNVGSAS